MTKWKIVPVEPKVAMLARAVLLNSEPSADDVRLASMAVDSHPKAPSSGMRAAVIVATSQIAMDYRTILAASPKASEDEELVERVARIMSAFEDTAKVYADRARAVLKMLENEHD